MCSSVWSEYAVWSRRVGGSNPPTQTKFMRGSVVDALLAHNQGDRGSSGDRNQRQLGEDETVFDDMCGVQSPRTTIVRTTRE